MDYTSPETYANDISRQTALAAHNGTSFVPEKRADSALASYAAATNITAPDDLRDIPFALQQLKQHFPARL